MELTLLRHAQAESWAPTDAERPLTPFGRRQAHRVGEWCRSHGTAPEILLASPYLRAQETAQAVAAALGVEVVTAPFLAVGMTPDGALDALREYARFDSILCVSHEPGLSQLVAHLLGLADSHSLVITPATVVEVELSSLRGGAARLQAFVPGPTV